MKNFHPSQKQPELSNTTIMPVDNTNVDQLTKAKNAKSMKTIKAPLISNVSGTSCECLNIEHLCKMTSKIKEYQKHSPKVLRKFNKKRIIIGTSVMLLTAGATVGAVVPLYGINSTAKNGDVPTPKTNSDVYILPDKKVKTYSGTNTTEAKKEIRNNISKFSSKDYENDLKSFINGLNNNPKEIKMKSKINSFDIMNAKTQSKVLNATAVAAKSINFDIDYTKQNISNHAIKIQNQTVAPNQIITINLVAANTSITPSMIGANNIKYASYTYDNLVSNTTYLDKNNKEQTITKKLLNYQISETKSYSMDFSFNGVSDSYVNINKDAESFLDNLTNTQITNDINQQFTLLNNKINDTTSDAFSLLKFMTWFTSNEKTRSPDSPGDLSILSMLSGLINLPFTPSELQTILSSFTREQMYQLIGWSAAEQKIVETDLATLNKVVKYLDSFKAPVSDYVKITNKINTPVTYDQAKHTVNYQYEYDYTVIKKLKIQLITPDNSDQVGLFSDLMTLNLKPFTKLDSMIPGIGKMVTQFASLQKKYNDNKSLADAFALPNYIWIGGPWTYKGWFSDTSFKGDSLKQIYSATNAPVTISYNNNLENQVSYQVNNLNLNNTLCLDSMASSIWNQYTVDATGFGKALQDFIHSFAKEVTDNKITTVDNFYNVDDFAFDESGYTNKGDIDNRTVSYIPNKTFKFAKSPLDITKADIIKLFKFDSDININNVAISLIPINMNTNKVTFGYLDKLETLSITLHFDKPVTYMNGTTHKNTTEISKTFGQSFFK